MGKGTKSIAFYLMMILVFGSLMYFIVKEGESQQVGTAVQTMQNAPQTMGEGFFVFWDSVTHHIQSSMGILLLQIITILIVCRLFGWMFQKIGQPTVIGEIVNVWMKYDDEKAVFPSIDHAPCAGNGTGA